MLLPGISGSYLLMILGKYTQVIEAVSNLALSLIHLTWNPEPIMLLFTFALGILFGALTFSRLIYWSLTHYHSQTLALLTGLMVGGLHVLSPTQMA